MPGFESIGLCCGETNVAGARSVRNSQVGITAIQQMHLLRSASVCTQRKELHWDLCLVTLNPNQPTICDPFALWLNPYVLVLVCLSYWQSADAVAHQKISVQYFFLFL